MTRYMGILQGGRLSGIRFYFQAEQDGFDDQGGTRQLVPISELEPNASEHDPLVYDAQSQRALREPLLQLSSSPLTVASGGSALLVVTGRAGSIIRLESSGWLPVDAISALADGAGAAQFTFSPPAGWRTSGLTFEALGAGRRRTACTLVVT